MLRRLKIKIIAVVLGSLLLVFSAVLFALNISVYQTSVKRTEIYMVSVVENDGFLFQPKSKPDKWHKGLGRDSFGEQDMMKAGRFFYAKFNFHGELIELNLDMMFDFSREDAQSFTASALESPKTRGAVGNFSFLKAEKPYGQIAVFAERSIEISLLEQLTRTSLWAAGIVSLILLCLAAFFAQWMVAPVKTAFAKQRRFISDASHELKTPLTIISANADVLQHEIGENQRLLQIKSQSERMGELVHGLLTLAKTDENHSNIIRSEFDLSGAVLNTALEFESRAFEEGRQYSYQIKKDVKYTGDEKQIKQLLSVLIDNAIQYSENGGEIIVTLHSGGKRPRISVYNTGVGIARDESGKIFERFYRSDESRSRETGGYGVGLSIAQAVVKSHRGKITVSGEYGKWVRFDVVL
ncbi:MAG: HAMP domain-containing histidine kinase [Oscillospiraceae bacterium]|jgi:signal transduction histidine kinase|nr:HAMP domain-containing histidine kinase [Oscillospiraceae bacterium]